MNSNEIEARTALVARLQSEAVVGADGRRRLPCARALQLAGELDLTPREIGQLLAEAGIKIAACQLGCFT